MHLDTTNLDLVANRHPQCSWVHEVVDRVSALAVGEVTRYRNETTFTPRIGFAFNRDARGQATLRLRQTDSVQEAVDAIGEYLKGSDDVVDYANLRAVHAARTGEAA